MSERRYDKTVEDTFPASDAPASSGIAGPEGDEKPAEKPLADQKPIGTPTADRAETEIKPQNW